jgi:hypothetical protein
MKVVERDVYFLRFLDEKQKEFLTKKSNEVNEACFNAGVRYSEMKNNTFHSNDINPHLEQFVGIFKCKNLFIPVWYNEHNIILTGILTLNLKSAIHEAELMSKENNVPTDETVTRDLK